MIRGRNRYPLLSGNARKRSCWIGVLVFGLLLSNVLFASDDLASVVHLKRGKLWESFTIGNTGQQFDNFRRHDYCMDWPGFDYEYVGTDIGGPYSHHAGSGFCIGALIGPDSLLLGIERWGLFPTSSIGTSPNDKYICTKNRLKYPNGENYWLQSDPNEAEEVVETVWEFNPSYVFDQDVRPYYLPIKVDRTARAWSGSQKDEDYIIIDYTITNTSFSDPDTLFDTYILFTYSFSVNHRSLQILYPQIANGGNRDNFFEYDSRRNLFFGYNGDYTEEPGDDTYDYWPTGGPDGEGEWLAPAYAGLQFLYISPNDNGEENHIHDYTWSAQDPTITTNPFSAITGLDKGSYTVLEEPSLGAYRAGDGEEHFGTERMITCVSLGPWTLLPGDSIRIVTAEVIGGISYNEAVDKYTNSFIVKMGKYTLFDNAERAQFNYDHGYNVPDPPPAPSFEIGRSDPQLGNVISWSDSVESLADADYSGEEAYDLAGYRVYRSVYLPIGPWDVIADVELGSADYYDAASGRYSVVDTNVTAGQGYYYALTSYDTGHNSWPPDPGAGRVRSLESSLHANRRMEPFYTGPPPREDFPSVRVVPNPFVMESGYTMPRDQDVIQFVNIPGNCTIRIYSIQGNLVKTIRHDDGTGMHKWNQVTDYGQFVESGVYMYHLYSEGTKKSTTGKFAIIK